MRPNIKNPSRGKAPAHYPGTDAQPFEEKVFGNHDEVMFLDDHPDSLRLLTDLLLFKGYSAFVPRDDHVRSRLASLEANLRGNVARLRQIQAELRSMNDPEAKSQHRTRLETED
jgi:hypothetical protein